jgi:hypothetical protein
MGAMRRARAPAGVSCPESAYQSAYAFHATRGMTSVQQRSIVFISTSCGTRLFIGVAKHPVDRQPAAQLFERAGK